MLEKLQHRAQALSNKMLSPMFIQSTAIISISTSMAILINTYITTLFLSVYPASKLSFYYFTQAIIFMVITLATQHISITKPKLFCLITQLTGIAIIILYYAGGHQWHYVTLLYCALLATLSAMCNLIAWNFIAWAYSMREFKENSSLFGSFGTLIGIAMGYLIPLIIHAFGVDVLAYLILAGFIGFIIPTLSLDISLNNTAFRPKKTGRLRQYKIFNYLVCYTLILVIAITLIDFVIKGTIGESNNSDKIASYMAMLYATSNVFVLFAQIALMKPLLRWLGPGGILLILPGALVVTASIYLFHPSIITASILFVSNLSINYSLYNLSREIVLNVMPPLIRAKGKAVIKGFASTLGAIIGSLLIFIAMKFFGIASNAVIVLLLAIIMLFLAFNIKTYYKESLKDQLLLKRFTSDELTSGIQSPEVYRSIIQNTIRSMDPGLNLLGLSILEKEKPGELPKEIKDWLRTGTGDIFMATLRLCTRIKDSSVVPILQQRLTETQDEQLTLKLLQALYFQDPSVAKTQAIPLLQSDSAKLKAYAAYILLQKGSLEEVTRAIQLLNTFIISAHPVERAEVASLLGNISVGDLTREITSLIQDENDIVSINAIYSAAKLREDNLAKFIMTQINRPQVAYHIIKLAHQFGDILLPYLKETLNTSTNLKEIVIAAKILCNIQTGASQDLIVNLLEKANFFTSYHLAKNFAYQCINKRPSPMNLKKITHIIHNHEHYIQTLLDAPKNTATFLQKEITVRLYWAKKCYLYLLAIISNAKEILPIIPNVAQAMQVGNVRNLNTALELIDTCLMTSEQKTMLSEVFDAAIVESAHLDIEHIAIRDPWLEQMANYIPLRTKGGIMETLEKVIILRNCSLFKDLPGESLLAIADEMQTVSFAAGDTVYQQGDFPEGLYIICAGEVDLLREQNKLLTLHQHDFFGFMGVIQNSPYYATAVTTQTSQMLYLDKATFDRILEDIPDVLLSFTHVLADYLARILEKKRLTFPT